MGCCCSGSKKYCQKEILNDLKNSLVQCEIELQKKQMKIINLKNSNKLNLVKIEEQEKEMIIKRKYDLQIIISKLQQSQYNQVSLVQQRKAAQIILDLQKQSVQDAEKNYKVQQQIKNYDLRLLQMNQQISLIQNETCIQHDQADFFNFKNSIELELQQQENHLRKITDKNRIQLRETLDFPSFEDQFFVPIKYPLLRSVQIDI